MANIDVCRLKISQLRALVAIADEGTFGKAALQLDVSQSAVSHAISTMEETLGVSLLNRGRQGAALTPVGEDIAEEARQVLASLERIGKTATSARGLETGQVRVACFRSVATHLIPSIIGRFQQRYPDIKVIITEHVSTDTIEADLLTGQADIGFVLLPTQKDLLETRAILRDEYVVLLPPTENPPAKLTWEQLEQYPLILPPRHVTCCAIVQDNFERYNRPFKLAYEITEDSTILSMVMQGLGATVMARLAADPIPKELRIAYPPEPMERVIGVAISSEALHPPAVYAFWETLQATSDDTESRVA
ncbi:MAG: LysR family transcriptional regulator [Thainema sp.]